MEQANIQNLVARAMRGDQEAFAALYENHVTPLYRYIYIRVRQREDAEDLTQQAFMKAWVALQARPTEIAFAPYLFTIARNLIIDRSRAHTIPPFSTDDSPEAADPAPSPLARAIIGEEYASLVVALDTLPHLQREVVLLRAFADMSYEDIARILEKAEPAVRQLYSRGIRALKEECHFDE